eukprot:augustus_masked-scaffold_23-processed-gene-2.53-mRNA-1 protein AED:1.00 eAED:1.00 QI:0/0/0/0/1/1/2/0/944
MGTLKKGSARVTRSGKQLAPLSDEDPLLSIGGGDPKNRTSSVDTAREENEFLPSSDQPTLMSSFGKDDPSVGGESVNRKKGLSLKVKLKTPVTSSKRKAIAKAVRPVVKKSKSVKAKAIGLVDEGGPSSKLVELDIPKRKSSAAYFKAKGVPKSSNSRDTQALDAETASGSSGDEIEEVDIIDRTIANQEKIVGNLGFEPDLDALSDDDRRDLAYRKYRLKKEQSIRKRGISEESLDYGAGAGVTSIERSATSVRNAESNDELYKEATRKLNDPTSGNAAGSLVEKKVMERDLLEFDSLNPQEKRKVFAKLRVQYERARIQNNTTLAALRSKNAENQAMGLPGHQAWPEKVGGEELDMEAAGLATNVDIGMFDAIQPSDPNAEELKRYVIINYVNSQAVSTYLPSLASQVNSTREEIYGEIEKRRFRNREIHQMIGDARGHVDALRVDTDKKMVDSKVYIDTLRADIKSLRDAVNEVSQLRAAPLVSTARVKHMLPKVDVLETLQMEKLGQWLNVVGELLTLDPSFQPRRFVHEKLLEKICRSEEDRDVVYYSLKDYYEKGKAENRQDPMRLLKEVKYPASGDSRERFQTYMMNVSSKIGEGYAERLGEEALIELLNEITRKVPSSFSLSKEAIRSKVRNFEDPLRSVEMLQTLLEAQRQFALDRGVDASNGQVPESGPKIKERKPRTPSVNRIGTPNVSKVANFVPFPMAASPVPINLTDFINRAFRRQMENPGGKSNYQTPRGLTSLKHYVIVKARMMMGGKESANDSRPHSGFKGSNVLALAAPPRKKELEDMKAMVPEGYDLMIEGTKEYPTLEVHVGEVSQFRNFGEGYEICTKSGNVIGDAKFDSGAEVTVGSWWKHKDLLESYSSASGNVHVANDAPVKILAVGYVGLVVRVNGLESRACPGAKVILVQSEDWPSFLIGRPELRKMGLDPAQNLGLR